MKNKLLIGVITFFTTIFLMILVLNLLDSESKKTFTFDRKFNLKNNVLKFDKIFNKLNDADNVMFVNSDNYLVERDVENIDDENNKYLFHIRDLNFKNKQNLNSVLPKGANLLFFNLEKVIFTKNFNLFEYSFNTKKINLIDFKGLKITYLKPILNSTTKFLCLAENHENNMFKTGFYLIDISTKEIQIIKHLETNKIDTFLPNSLKYIGKFLYNENNIISYCCEKYSKIYFFNDKGIFLKELQTNDKVPLPKIAENNQGNNFYSRDGTWYSNMGMFINNNSVFVFSAASDDKDYISIDEYSYSKMDYIQSYKLNYKNMNSNNIMNACQYKNNMIICFDYNYASFKIL